MAHPFQSARADKVSGDRAQKFTKGFASGGAVHSDEKEDRQLVKSMVDKGSLKASSKKAKVRPDRLHRASGGRANKKSAKTNINITVAPQEGAAAKPPMPMPPVMPPPGPPPMPPPGAGGPPGMPPGGPPGAPPGMPGRPTPLMAGMSGMPTVNAMPLRARGGRLVQFYAKGGSVKRADGGPIAAGVDNKGNTVGVNTKGEVVPPPKLDPSPKKSGGAVKRAKGGRVDQGPGGDGAKDGAAWKESLSAGTKVQGSPGKSDLADIKSKPAALVRARGGKVEQEHKFPKMKFGAYGGKGRLEKAAMQKKSYP